MQHAGVGRSRHPSLRHRGLDQPRHIEFLPDGSILIPERPGRLRIVRNGKLDPNPVAVHVCDSIVWKNTHDQPHTATGNGDVTWNTGTIVPDAESEPVLFDQAGELTYICALHPFMKGTVEVS